MSPDHRRHAVIGVAVTWLPLAAFTALQMGSPSVPGAASFWSDVGANARYLISVPLLILGDEICLPRLWRLIHHFPRAGLIEDHARFETAVASARTAFESRAAFAALCVASWAAAAAITLTLPAEQVPAWHFATGGSTRYSAAGWWHVLVSLPISVLLVLTWFWRIGVWALLLRRIAGCRLQLIASHPDGSAGLGFLGGSIRAFGPVAFALSTLTASREAQSTLSHHAVWTEHLYLNVGFAVFIMLLIVAPLCAFTPMLMHVAAHGGRAYGTLAHRMGRAFERRWIADDAPPFTDEALQVQDFSATTDLYAIVANTRSLRTVPVSRRHLITLAIALALPFAPVLLLRVPLGTLLSELRGMLF